MSDEFDDSVLDDDLLDEMNGDRTESEQDEDVEMADPIEDEDGEPSQIEQRLEETRQRAREFGHHVRAFDWLGLVKFSLYGWVLMVVVLLSPILRVLPMSWKLYHKLHLWSAWQMQKASGADALANVRHPNGKEDVLPAAYVESGETDKQRTGWKIKGIEGKRYDPGVQGGTSSRMGKADLIHVNEDDLEQGTWAECAIDSAFQLNRERYLFRDAQLNMEIVGPGAQPQGQGAAIADGGTSWPQSVNVSIDRPGVLEETLVPLTSRRGFDGQLISWDQYSNIKNEKSDQETVREVQNAGWMAAKLDDIGKTDLIKWAIILGVAGAVLLFHQDIGALISGGSGGDGGVAPSAGLGMLPLIWTRLGGD